MNVKKSLVVAVPALLCGALLGYLVRPAAPAAPQPAPEVKPERPVRKAKPAADDAALNRLRSRIQELEKQLAAKEAPPPAEGEKVETTPPAPPPEARRRGPGGWPQNAAAMRAHLEEIRKNNPEQYTAMTNDWAQHRARSLERAQGKLDILASVDVNRLSPKQRDIHEQYQGLIARNEEIQELMDLKNTDVTDEQRDALWKEMHENRDKMRELAQAERETLLAHTATSFGVKGEAAGELVETVKAVYQATEHWGGWGPGRRGGPGGGRGGPGGGRGGPGGGPGGRR